jgi:hypothetical protein
MVAISDAGPAELKNSVVNVTDEQSGHKRNPAVIYDGEFIHLVYRNMAGVVNYMKGEISGTSKVEGIELEDNPWAISVDEIGWTLRGEDASYILYDLNGRILETGEFFNELLIPVNNQAMILQLRNDQQVQSFKLLK